MKGRAVCYLISGPAHLPYLVVSLYTLRKHWSGEVRVYVWPESQSIVERIAQDSRLDIQVIPREPRYRGKNAQGLDRIRLAQEVKDVHEDLADLFRVAEQCGYTATQFCDWVSCGAKISRRVDRLRSVIEGERHGWIDAVLDPSARWPSVNCGVFASRCDSPVLPVWEKWTWVCCPCLLLAAS